MGILGHNPGGADQPRAADMMWGGVIYLQRATFPQYFRGIHHLGSCDGAPADDEDYAPGGGDVAGKRNSADLHVGIVASIAASPEN